MQRPQKTAKAGCPCEGMLETKSNRGACSIALTERDREDGAENLLERILDRNNLEYACEMMLTFSSAPSIRTIATLLKNSKAPEKPADKTDDSNIYGITRGAAY